MYFLFLIYPMNLSFRAHGHKTGQKNISCIFYTENIFETFFDFQ